jgi:hypothetical protein
MSTFVNLFKCEPAFSPLLSSHPYLFCLSIPETFLDVLLVCPVTTGTVAAALITIHVISRTHTVCQWHSDPQAKVELQVGFLVIITVICL